MDMEYDIITLHMNRDDDCDLYVAKPIVMHRNRPSSFIRKREYVQTIRHSCRMACFTRRDNTLCVYLVKRRFTYAFSDFIINNKKNSSDAGIALIDSMTPHEKSILRFNHNNYERLWIEIFGSTVLPRYKNHKASYDKLYLHKHNEIIYRTNLPSNIDTPWTLPGGQSKYEETHIDAAMRELEEECGINKVRVRCVKPFISTQIDGSIIYKSTIFMCDLLPGNVIGYAGTEISHVELMSLNQMRLIDEKLYGFMKPIFEYYRKSI
jgi:ADP-ribose pyrophosphatase YjhB (NUDIX family)